MKFKELGLKKELCIALKKEKIENPTKVQEEVFKKVIDKENLIVQSQTGTGKTLAYLLPLLQRTDWSSRCVQILILVPTHELAMQVHRQIMKLSKNSEGGFSSAAIVGNVNIDRQIDALKKKPQIVVGTSGRILELLQKRKLKVHTVETIVIDEADKMLDKNNLNTTKAVLKSCMRDVQVLLCSASMDTASEFAERELSKNFELIKSEGGNVIPKEIKHIYLVVERRDKIETLRKLAKSLNPKKAMVFINKVSDIEEATQKLQYHKYNAKCIYGESRKQDRQNAIREFDTGKLQYLIGTDLAARGLHFEDVDAVFHISIPERSEDYLHRAGRTGRNNKSGISVLIITKEELSRIKQFQKELNIQILPKKMYQGKVVRG
jgi:superfamily II DNA/RNA helicase